MRNPVVLILLWLLCVSVTESQGQTQNAFGASVASAGDVNADGYPDLLIGEPLFYQGSRDGRVFLIPGGPGKIDSIDLWIVIGGAEASGEFGFSVSGIGDVNGDGTDDFVVGAELAGPGWDGRAYVYFGRPGFDGTGGDLLPDVTLKGNVADERFGWEVAGIGDVNDDGFDDVIVSNAGFFAGEGRAYVFFGGTPMDSTADILLVGDTPNDGFGWHVSKAGDLNNDGVSDFIVTVRADDGGGTDAGKANVYFGGSELDSIPDLVLAGPGPGARFGSGSNGVGDVNGDTCDDIVVAAAGARKAFVYFGGPTVDSIPDLIIEGGELWFGKSVAGLGDVNMDGFTDFIVTGSPQYNNQGGGFVYYGGSPMDSLSDLVYGGTSPTDFLGWDVAGLGDFNGDGRPDWVMGGPYWPDLRVGADRVLIVFSAKPDTLTWIYGGKDKMVTSVE